MTDGDSAPRTSIGDGNRSSDTKSGSVQLRGDLDVRSSVSGRIDLPNGQFITTVRKDVMDRALGRGEFRKK